MGKNQHSFTPEKKAELLLQIAELRYRGLTFGGIATELKISYQTVAKYFNEVISASKPPDPVHLVTEYRESTSRMVDRAIGEYYKGRMQPKEVIAMMDFANKFNGVNKHLESVTPERPPNLLQIEVVNVPFELPPTREQPTEPQE